MATYEFQCDQCGTFATIYRDINDDGDVDAGNCMACAIPMTRIWAAMLQLYSKARDGVSHD
jgi:predicted nucleic acid-binding Zn ribbon protein